MNDNINTIIINMRVGDLWFLTNYVELNGKLHSIQSHYDYLSLCYLSEKNNEDEDDEEE